MLCCYSKSGRPLKKLSDRKGFSRLGHMANGGSPDCSGNIRKMHFVPFLTLHATHVKEIIEQIVRKYSMLMVL